MRLIARLLAIIALSLGMSAISLAQTATSSGSSVKIVGIVPELSGPLYVGEKQTIVVEVEYVMSQDSGTITLVIQKGESGGRPLGSSTEVVLKGKGKIKLEAVIQVPDTKAIQVFTPLSYQDGAGTSIVDYRAYRVARRQLDVSIWLFFADADPISIRTLAGAASTVLADLIEAKHPNGSWRARIIDDSGLPRAQVISIINEAPNFFKHADRDPDAFMLFEHEENDDVLFVCVLEFGELDQTSLYMQAFQIWYMAAHPDRFTSPIPQIAVAQRVFPELDKLPRPEQIARGAKFINDVKGHGDQAFAA